MTYAWVSPTLHPFTERLILHIALNQSVRILKLLVTIHQVNTDYNQIKQWISGCLQFTDMYIITTAPHITAITIIHSFLSFHIWFRKQRNKWTWPHYHVQQTKDCFSEPLPKITRPFIRKRKKKLFEWTFGPWFLKEKTEGQRMKIIVMNPCLHYFAVIIFQLRLHIIPSSIHDS